jgi:hypothetical protein
VANRCACLMVVLVLCLPLWAAAAGQAAAGRDTVSVHNGTVTLRALGQTAEEGHGFVYSRVTSWEPDVFAFLDQHVRK